MFSSHFDLCDFVSILIHCEDDTFLIVQEPNTQEYWIPSGKVPAGKTWKHTARNILDAVRLSAPIRNICYTVKVWKPFGNNILYHIVFLVQVTKDAKSIHVPPRGKNLFWAKTNELQMSYQRLRSQELLDFISVVAQRDVQRPKLKGQKMVFANQTSWTSIINEDGIAAMTEITENHIRLSKCIVHRKIIGIADFSNETHLSIYCLFLMSCFPCSYMNLRIFTTLCERLGWDRLAAINLFSAADIDYRGFLSFREFLYIVCIADPNCQHGFDCEIRHVYIFRYYDTNNDGMLDISEAKVLFNDMRQAKFRTQDSMALSRDFEAFAKLLGVEQTSLNSDVFANNLTYIALRGTSVLLRFSRSVTVLCPNIMDTAPKQTDISRPNPLSPPKRAIASTNKSLEYGVAAHCIKLKRQGTVIDQIWNMTGAMSDTSLNLGKASLMNSPSLEAFNPTKVHFEVMRGLEYFEKEIHATESKTRKKQKIAFHWGQVDQKGFARCLIKLSDTVASIMASEPRLLEITSPVYTLGDLHGNFADLLRFEKALWPLGPSLSPATILTLGDYVDRGPHSIELIAYLFAYKAQCPHKVLMLRGNHEMRQVQDQFSFHDECCSKFGESLGTNVWEAINRAMDCLPLAALIDGKVFCVHGGIPPPWVCPSVKAILSIPCPLPQPEEQSELAWELMWNDPVVEADATPGLLKELQLKEGFAPNAHRQTGHVFNTDALMRFLKVNNCDIVLRAHQMQQRGFFIQMRQRLETVFSSPNYGTARNDGACVLVDRGRLRTYVIPSLPTHS